MMHRRGGGKFRGGGNRNFQPGNSQSGDRFHVGMC